MNILYGIHTAIVQCDYLKLQGILLSNQFKSITNGSLALPQDIILKSDYKKGRSNLIKYEVTNIQDGIIKILKFIQLNLGNQTLFARDKTGKDFLDYAVCKGYLKILSQFFENNKINDVTGDDYMMEGAKFNSWECVRWLCHREECLWRKNKAKQSALDISILNGAKQCEEILREFIEKNEKKLLLYQIYCGHFQPGVGESISKILTYHNLQSIFKYL